MTKTLLNARDLATLCQVDLKTIHNWCAAGRFEFILTPGRHIRVRVAEAVRFLRAYHYDVPAELAALAGGGVLVIGDEVLRAAVGRVVASTARVRHAHHAYDGLVLAGQEAAALFVVGEEAVPLPVSTYLHALVRACPAARIAFVAGGSAPGLVGLPLTLVAKSDRLGLEAALGPFGAAA